MDAKLVVVGGKASADEFQLNLPTVLGRSRSASLPVGHPLVSRKHCELYEQDGYLMVRDLGSLNGTFVDDHRLAEEPVVLKPGGLLTIGSVTFQAVYGAVTEPSVIDDDQPDFSHVETGSVSKIAQIKQTIHAESLEDLEQPAGDDATPGPAGREHTETLPVGDSGIESVNRDDGFDLNWLDEDEDSSSPEDTAEVAIPMAKPTKPPALAKPRAPRPAPPATENETVPVDPPAAAQAGDDEEDLDDFLNSLK